jgi:hypothetical protein
VSNLIPAVSRNTDRVEILTLSTSDLEWSPFLSGMTTPSENEKLLNQLVNMVHQKVIQLLDKAGAGWTRYSSHRN